MQARCGALRFLSLSLFLPSFSTSICCNPLNPRKAAFLTSHSGENGVEGKFCAISHARRLSNQRHRAIASSASVRSFRIGRLRGMFTHWRVSFSSAGLVVRARRCSEDAVDTAQLSPLVSPNRAFQSLSS